VELVVHSAPGGGSDVFAQAVAEMAQAEHLLAQPLRVVNKTAGASAQAMEYLAERKGDDHTIACLHEHLVRHAADSQGIRPHGEGFHAAGSPGARADDRRGAADSSYRTMADFVAAAKKDPGGLKQAGGSATAIESLTGLLIQSATGAKWTFITRLR
jgi:putative tricarboxylic transport membrane protein